ncbi:MAG: helix-turn-helix domain-containing protein [Anaerovorax sp.]|nr:helix-turn-helix domain-containing protein [Anaerovorax sp.]
MILAYVLENMGPTDFRNNQNVFLLIKDLEISENNQYFDSNLERLELFKLIEVLQAKDRLVIRSVMDLADSLSDLIGVFQKLTEKQITLCSCEEDYLCGDDYLDTLNGFAQLYVDFEKKKQQQSYQKALDSGSVGRPAKAKEVEQALDMYQSGKYKVNQIESITGVSKSTLYRYLKNE